MGLVLDFQRVMDLAARSRILWQQHVVRHKPVCVGRMVRYGCAHWQTLFVQYSYDLFPLTGVTAEPTQTDSWTRGTRKDQEVVACLLAPLPCLFFLNIQQSPSSNARVWTGIALGYAWV